MGERRLDASDTTLRNSVVFKVVQALRHANHRPTVKSSGFVPNTLTVCLTQLRHRSSKRHSMTIGCGR